MPSQFDKDPNQQIVVDDIADVSADVRALRPVVRDTNRDVAEVKDDVAAIRQQLAQLAAGQKVNNNKARPSVTKKSTRSGTNTLMGVSLNDLALQIKRQNPQKSFQQARQDAKSIKDARSTLDTGGGGFLNNVKSSLLRKTLGENLGTKASRALTSKATQEKAAQTLINYDDGKAKRQQATEPVMALQQQVGQLTSAVVKGQAEKVDAPPTKVEKKMQEDLTDTISALKVLGFEMKEIKERLSTAPKGMTTEDRIKHALKSDSERIKVRDAHIEVQRQIEANKPPAVAQATPVPASGTNSVTPPASPTPTSTPVNSSRGGVPADQLADKNKQDLKDTEGKNKQEADEKKQNKILSTLHGIQDTLAKSKSESLIGLLVVALGALLLPVIKAVWEKVKMIWDAVSNVVKGVVDKVKGIWDRNFSQDKNSLNMKRGKRDQALQDAAERASTPEEAERLRKQIQTNRELDANDDDNLANAKKQGFPTSAAEAIQQGKYTYKTFNNGIETDVALTPEQLKQAGLTPKGQAKGKNTASVPAAASSSSDKAAAMEKSSDERTSMTTAASAPSVIVQPIQHTEKQVPVVVGGGGGGDSAVALLMARNNEPSSQGYIADIFDHPNSYGPSF